MDLMDDHVDVDHIMNLNNINENVHGQNIPSNSGSSVYEHNIQNNVHEHSILGQNVQQHVLEQNIQHNDLEHNIQHNVLEQTIQHNVLEQNIQHNVLEQSIQHNVLEPNIQHNILDQNIQHNVHEQNIENNVHKPNIPQTEQIIPQNINIQQDLPDPNLQIGNIEHCIQNNITEAKVENNVNNQNNENIFNAENIQNNENTNDQCQIDLNNIQQNGIDHSRTDSNGTETKECITQEEFAAQLNNGPLKVEQTESTDTSFQSNKSPKKENEDPNEYKHAHDFATSVLEVVLKNEFENFNNEEIDTGSHVVVSPDDDSQNKKIIYKCRECKQTFLKKRELVHHILEIHYEGQTQSWNCKTCNFVFSDRKVFGDHIYNEHLESKKYKCNKCDCEYSKKSFLVKHFNTVHWFHGQEEKTELLKSAYLNKKEKKGQKMNGKLRRNAFKCKFCTFSCENKFELGGHIYNKHILVNIKKSQRANRANKKLDNSLKCIQCGYLSKSQFQLKRHFEVIHWSMKPLSCEDCDIKFGSNEKLSKHMRVTHKSPISVGGNRNYPCDECGKAFLKKSHLDRHKDGVHVENNELMKCPDCDHTSRSHYNLGRHIKSMHHKEPSPVKKVVKTVKRVYKKTNEFKCTECNFVCKHPDFLIEHAKKLHDIVKPFKCDQCTLSFGYKAYLDSHKRTVHAEKKFQCKICPYKSTKKFFLDAHINQVHLKLRPFDCSECDKKFSSKYDLGNHVQVKHRKVKPHQCPHCEMSFGIRTYLNRHIKVVHDKTAVNKPKKTSTGQKRVRKEKPPKPPQESPSCSYKSVDRQKEEFSKELGLLDISHNYNKPQDYSQRDYNNPSLCNPQQQDSREFPVNFSTGGVCPPQQERHEISDRAFPGMNFNPGAIRPPPQAGSDRAFPGMNFNPGAIRPPPQGARQGGAYDRFFWGDFGVTGDVSRSLWGGFS